MFIGFLSYTNEAVIEEVEEKDLSILDESVMHDLDLKNVEMRDLNNRKTELSFLEKLVEEQKQKRTKKTPVDDICLGRANAKGQP